MKSLEMYQTLDGRLHASQEKAVAHLSNRRHCIMEKIAHRICQTNWKYAEVIAILENELDSFRDISELTAELQGEID